MSRVRRLLVFGPVFVAVAMFGLAPAGAVSPINPENRPTPIPGAVNGEVPRSRLVNVIPHCTTARDAGPSLMRIFTMARQARVALGAEECYRILADQVTYANRANQPGNNPAC